MAKRIGVFGGSFNPLHIGHLIVAEAAWQEFNLEQVVFVPTGDTPHKNMHHISKIDRFEMVKMAIKENPHFSISSIEIERKGLSYTVDTIKQLHAEWGSEYDIYFIAGTDASLANMDYIWYASPNAEALAEYPAYYEEQNGEALDQELYNIMAAPADVLDRCELYVNLPQETLKYYDKLWTQLGV